MQIGLKAMKYYCKYEIKIEGPLRLADYGFGPPRHTNDHIKKEIAILIMLEIAIFFTLARSLSVKITKIKMRTHTSYMQEVFVTNR